MNIFNKYLMIVFAFALGAVLITACGSQDGEDAPLHRLSLVHRSPLVGPGSTLECEFR